MWPDDSPFLHFIYGLRPCSSTEYNYSVRAKPCCTFTRRPHFQNLPCQNFEKITFSFSQNAQSLRLWKSTLTQNRIHSTIFEILIISFSKWTYATSTYLFSYRSRMLPVSISLAIGDFTCFAKAYAPLRAVRDSDIFTISAPLHDKATIVMLLSGDTCRCITSGGGTQGCPLGCSGRPFP